MRRVQLHSFAGVASLALLSACASAPNALHVSSAPSAWSTEPEREPSSVSREMRSLDMYRPAAPASRDSTSNDDYARLGPTIGVGAVWPFSFFDLDSAESSLGRNISVEETLGGEGRLGYRFLNCLAVEGVYQYLNRFDFNAPNTIAQARAWDATANLKAYLPFGAFQPYGLAGIGVFNLDFDSANNSGIGSDKTELMWRFGAGFDAYLARNVILYGEAAYNVPQDDLRDFQFMTVSAGVQYRF